MQILVLGPEECLEHQVLEELVRRRDPRDQEAFLVLEEHQEEQKQMAGLGLEVREEHRVHQGHQVLRVLEEMMVR